MPPAKKWESANLDLLRSVAVLLVLVDHFAVASGLLQKSHNFGAFGRLGVLLFFVHTSLVLMMSLERSRFAGRPREVLAFYVRRALRIYPLSLVCVCAVITAGVPFMPLSNSVPRTPGVVVSNLLLIQNLTRQHDIIGPLWSLPLEIQMYLCLPFLYLLAVKYGVRGVLCFEVVAVILFRARYWAIAHAIPGAAPLDILEFVPCFGAGILAYAILHRSRTSDRRPFAGMLWLPALALVVAGYLLAHNIWPSPRFHVPRREWVTCVAVAVMIPLFREVSTRWLARAGAVVAKYSYGIYLWQVIALWIGFEIFSQTAFAVRVAISIAALAILAWGSYQLVEHPGVRLGARLADRFLQATAPARARTATAP